MSEVQNMLTSGSEGQCPARCHLVCRVVDGGGFTPALDAAGSQRCISSLLLPPIHKAHIIVNL